MYIHIARLSRPKIGVYTFACLFRLFTKFTKPQLISCVHCWKSENSKVS